MKTCPSALVLDNWELHAQDDSVGAHLAECETCRRRIAERRLHNEQFRENWLPIVRQRVQAAVASPHPAPWFVSKRALLLAPLALAAALALVVGPTANKPTTASRPAKPPESYVGSKGGPSIEIVMKRREETSTLEPASLVIAGDELRFIPRGIPGEYRYFQLGALNGDVYEPLYPASPDKESILLPELGSPLPGAIVLDEAPGPERIFVLLTKHPVAAGWAAEAAKEMPAGPFQARVLQDTSAIAGWIVLNKR